MGRPRKQINVEMVTELARLGCTAEEIASVLGCHRNTIDRRFSEVIKRGREHLKHSLRRWQVISAKNGSVAMQIWLGKQYLGQSDKQEVVERKIDYATLSDEDLEALAAAESIG